MSTENALLTILTEKINNDSLVLPTLPEIAIKVRKAADDPDINLAKLAEVISQDPALSARMIKISNSAFMGRTIKVDTLNQAVTRIGLRQIKNIVTALAMEQLFVSKNPIVKRYMNETWKRTVDVAAYAITLMQYYLKRNKHANLDIDTIALAALIFNIGALPIFTEAERHEDVFANPSFLAGAIEKMGGKIGAEIMRAWDFTDEFVEVAEKWRDLSYEADKPCYTDFVRIAAVKNGLLTEMTEPENYLSSMVEKEIIESKSLLNDDEFLSDLGDARSIFA
ncbi:HDOD domain-containing protein [Algicola sagamiensis]|uniref:HDOD domain-containing protein n=1 Tax=Algicola sagamiensis TaxID=163869 RepID=UPI000363CBB2|nr:HDOD domain-containing protein [Algicola sagamiensis]